MQWISFAYSFSKNKSSARVTLWRRLQRLGAIAPAGNLYVLPNLPECAEAFQWLTQEVQQADGQAVMLYFDKFEGMSEQALIELFCDARGKEYTAVKTEAITLEQQFADETAPKQAPYQTAVAKLRRQFADISRIDYFDCPEQAVTFNHLAQLEKRIAGEPLVTVTIPQLNLANFQQQTWVTRPRPHVDRLSSIWLIRRFIDAEATVRFSDKLRQGELGFDMPNAQFSHTGNLCTFETMVHSFQIEADGLSKLAEIVHEIDLHDGLYNHPETVGVDAVLKGWLAQGLTDDQLVENGLALFDGLLASAKGI